MIDTHIHLDFKEFDCDREEAIKRFFGAGGEKLINVGCDLASSERSVELAKKHENIFASVGVHPHDAEMMDEEALKKMEQLVVKEKVIAVGEIGLDFFVPLVGGLSPRERQIDAFKIQLELAENHKKPVIIHCRDAYVDLLEILKNYKSSGWQGTAHCFLGSWPIAEELIKLGFHIGFTGAVTYPKKRLLKEPLGLNFNVEPEIFKVIKNTPLDRILIETDCPFLAPVPRRGERNEPSFIKHVAAKIAELKGVNIEEIEKATSENARKLFGI